MKFIQEQRDCLVGTKKTTTEMVSEKKSKGRKIVLGTVLSIATAIGMNGMPDKHVNGSPTEIKQSAKSLLKHRKKIKRSGKSKSKEPSPLSYPSPDNSPDPPKIINELVLKKSQIESELITSKIKKGEITYEKDYIRFRGYYSKYFLSLPFNIKAKFFKKDDVVGLKVIEMSLNGDKATSSNINKVQDKLNKLIQNPKIKKTDFIKIKDNENILYRQEL